MRDKEPFGLPAEVLRPGKIIADPVHGDVGLTKLEVQIVDSPVFQRLRRVRQLGTTHEVYPGATHTRFSHSLGAVRAVQVLLDYAVEQRDGLHPVADLLGQWDDLGLVEYERELARATVLARLGALLHDICHVPFGHSIEDEMGILARHDNNEWRLEEVWGRFDEGLQELLGRQGLDEALKAVISPELPIDSAVVRDYAFVRDLVGNTICADLADYLARDHLFAGLPIALGHRFLSALFIVPDGEDRFSARRMALSISRGGEERADVITELLKYLRYRYELGERVLAHHAKLRADAMIGKALLLWRDEQAEMLASRLSLAAEAAQEQANRELEMMLLNSGDDGLLEHLSAFQAPTGDPKGRQKAVKGLARDLLDRKLFELAGRSGPKHAPAKELMELYEEPSSRQQLERELAEYAEIEPWKLAVWLPPRGMGVKAAAVRVFDGEVVMPFNEYERSRGKRGSEIEDSHRALWTVSVLVDRSVTLKSRQEIVTRMAQMFRIFWERSKPLEGLDLGDDTEFWPERLAALRAAADLDGISAADVFDRVELAPARLKEPAPRTFSALQARYSEVARSMEGELRSQERESSPSPENS